MDVRLSFMVRSLLDHSTHERHRGCGVTAALPYDFAMEKEAPAPPRVAPSNEEAHEAWDGPLFERFVKYRDLVTDGLGAHGEAALAAHPPNPGDRALDIGCGFGDTTQRLVQLVRPNGSAIGIDVSENFIETARREAKAASLSNIGFMVGDVQVIELEQSFDYAFSRMGVMFFASPVIAMRNIRRALVPGGRLCAVVWRNRFDNEWVHRAEKVVERYLEEPEDSDEPTCGPGPFSMAGADTASDILLEAGFEQVEFRRCDLPITIGRDLDHAIAFNLALGPAGEVVRLVGPDEANRVRPRIEAELREALSEFVQPDGSVVAPASTWIVSATAPEASA
jgi:SAM-dependent methyltransferase